MPDEVNRNDPNYQAYLTARRLTEQARRNLARSSFQPIPPLDRIIGTDEYFQARDSRLPSRTSSTRSYTNTPVTRATEIAEAQAVLDRLPVGARRLFPGRQIYTGGYGFMSDRGTGNLYYLAPGNRHWRSFNSDDNGFYRATGVSGTATIETVTVTPPPPPGGAAGGSSVTGTTSTTTPARNIIPPRAGDPVGYNPSTGQSPIHVENFDTDLTGLTFSVRRNARDRQVTVDFKPQVATSRDMFENRRSAHQDMWDAGIRIIPQFAQETHQGARGLHTTHRLTGFRVEFYNPGSYTATTRRNFYTWYSLDGTARAANASSYTVENTDINVTR